MLDKIKRLLNSNSVDRLQSKSDGILNVFRETVNELSLVNSQINEEIKFREEEIKRLTSDKLKLSDNRISNEKVINKINSFLQ